MVARQGQGALNSEYYDQLEHSPPAMSPPPLFSLSNELLIEIISNLCPADICRTTDGVSLDRAACAIDAPKSGITVEAYDPPAQVIADIERIMQHSGIDIGGVEYLTDSRDGQRYYYDTNALSNFVADGPRVLGFDPFAKLVDWLEAEAAVVNQRRLAGVSA